MAKKFKNLAAELEYEHIQELKAKNESAFLVKDTEDSKVYLKILNRGEQLFYQENDRAFICEISLPHNVVFIETIKKWNTGTKLTPQEKEEVINNIQRFFKNNYNTDINFT
ncbi:MAG TPA: hypothetical protein PLZ08_10890 [Bacillota bacterium]|jgi:hypothetical protein|nr:hypothetical protein [Bacillota bacterium]HOL10911.1 hypothetical protein [Bacillota bacterium]HPO98444.1 hypothetical protein [Bacillota bacterium]